MSDATGDIPMQHTAWWHELMEGICGPRKGGARIIIDAEDAETGVGKTGLAVYLARALSTAFGYELKKEDFTLSGMHYLQRWREHPGKEQPSVLVLDELGGAGSGHARRAMAQQNVDLGNVWQLMRKKRMVSIVTLPHWKKADIELRQQANYRLWCLVKPIGYFKPYSVGAGFDDSSPFTQGYDDTSRIRFPNLEEIGEPFYEHITSKKDELLDSNYLDADKLQPDSDEQQLLDPEEAEREIKKQLAQEKRNKGMTQTEIAEHLDMDQSWVSRNTTNPEGAT